MTKEDDNELTQEELNTPLSQVDLDRIEAGRKRFLAASEPTPPTPAGAGTETPSREFSSNPHDHGMVPDTFSPPGFTSWRLRTNDEWVALTEALRRQAEADRAKYASAETVVGEMLEEKKRWLMDNIFLRSQLATADKDRDEAREERDFCLAATDATEWIRINAMSGEEVKKELLEKGYTDERIKAGLDRIRAMFALQPSPSLGHGATGEKP